MNKMTVRNSLNRAFASLILNDKKLYGKIRKNSVVAVAEFKEETTITLASGTTFTVQQKVKEVSKILGI